MQSSEHHLIYTVREITVKEKHFRLLEWQRQQKKSSVLAQNGSTTGKKKRKRLVRVKASVQSMEI